MQVASICGSFVAVVGRNSSVKETAELMRRHHVGAVVVTDTWEGEQVPVGILTDRDIVVSVVAMDLDPRDLTAGEIMSEDLVIISGDCDVYDAISKMRSEGVRRMPVVNSNGALTGIISLDDLFPLVSHELSSLAKLPSAGQQRERAFRH